MSGNWDQVFGAGKGGEMRVLQSSIVPPRTYPRRWKDHGWMHPLSSLVESPAASRKMIAPIYLEQRLFQIPRQTYDSLALTRTMIAFHPLRGNTEYSGLIVYWNIVALCARQGHLFWERAPGSAAVWNYLQWPHGLWMWRRDVTCAIQYPQAFPLEYHLDVMRAKGNNHPGQFHSKSRHLQTSLKCGNDIICIYETTYTNVYGYAINGRLGRRNDDRAVPAISTLPAVDISIYRWVITQEGTYAR